MKPEELLAHGDFVRSLAMQLVLDESRAADVVQQTWLASLEHPLVAGKPPRSWLGRVVRNFAFRLRRTEARIRAREQAAARPERVMSTEEVVSREEIRQRVVKAVLGLSEPYRSTLLFRYYENLPPRDVARRMDVPVETVRTRTRRGLEQMRRQLDALHEGGRGQWLAALGPIAGLKLAVTSAKASVPSSAAGGLMGGILSPASGAIVMSSKVKIAAAGVFVLGVVICSICLLYPDYDGDASYTGLKAEDSENRLVEDEAYAGPDANGLEPVQDTALQESDKTAVTSRGSFISGRVIDKKTKEPVTSFLVSLTYKDDGGARKTAVEETVEQAEGQFHFPLELSGTFRFRVMSSCYESWDQSDLEVPEGDGLTGLLVELDPGYEVTGRVVDDATDKPVAGAWVGPASFPNEARLEYRLVDSPHKSHCTVTDRKGCFSLGGLPKHASYDFEGKWRLAAAHPGFAESVVLVEIFTEEEIEIRLKKGFRIYGKALDDTGMACPGLMITMSGDENPMPRSVLTQPDGSYTLPPTLPGEVFLHAGPPPGNEEEYENFTEEMKRVLVRDRDVEVNFGLTEQHVTWRGTFFDASGTPIPGGTINLQPVGMTSWESFWYQVQRSIKTDAKGRFEVGKLLCGDYNLKFHYRDWTVHMDGGVISFPYPGIVDRDLRVSGAMIQGVVVDAETNAPFIDKKGEAQASRFIGGYKRYEVPIDKTGRFSLEGVEPGRYHVGGRVEGYPFTWATEIDVEKNEVIRDVRISLRPGGTFVLKLTGFEKLENRNFKYNIEHVDRDWHSYRWEVIDPTGIWEFERDLIRGSGTVLVEFENGLMAERPYEIREGETTEVVIRRDEIIPFEGTVTVAGTFTHSDGSPVVDARLTFYRLGRYDLDRNESFRTGRTDSDGRFNIKGFKPGRWKVTGFPSGGGARIFPQLFIPAQPADPVLLDLVLPAGTIFGMIFDKKTGLPLKSREPFWSVRLFDMESTEDVASTHFKSEYGERFTLVGVPEGVYELRVFAMGYQEYKRENIRLIEGQHLDLGKLHVEPGPLLELEVVDGQGKPINSFNFFFNGEEIRAHHGAVDLSPGKIRYFLLPPGKATIRVTAKGYSDWHENIDLFCGKTLDLKICLSKDQ